MKESLLTFGIVLLFTFTSCEYIKENNNCDIFFKISGGNQYKFTDIELYDSSTHMLYFKTAQESFKDILGNAFAFMDNGEIIYQGSFVPGYSNSIPSGPFIMSPSMYGNYALRIDQWIFNGPDLRNSPKIISLLINHNLLHSGFSGRIDSVEIIGTQLAFKFTIINQDESDLLILDLNKTGPNLFHYFTNGLYIRDSNQNEVFSSNITHQKPEPWDSLEIKGLSKINSGDSLHYIINYTINTPLNPGEYKASFEFPGLGYPVSRDQLYIDNVRKWLGDIEITKMIRIQ